MANFTAADVKKLRELTGAGMMDCKNALDEADGDFDKAVEILRVKGQKGVAKREGRTASNGAVVSLHRRRQHRRRPARAELRDRLRRQGREVLGRRRRARRARRRDQARPTSRRCSPPRSRPARPSRRSSTRPTPPSARRSCCDRFAQFTDGYVAAYLHRTSPDLPAAGRRAGRAGQGERARSPRTSRSTSPRSRRSTSPATRSRPRRVENERRVAEATAREEGKPEAALPKIVEGRVNGFFKENVAARAGVRQGQQEDRPEGPGRGRRHAEALRPLPRRRLSLSRRRRESDLRPR